MTAAKPLALLERGEVAGLPPWLLTWQPAVLWLAGANFETTRRTYSLAVRAFMQFAAVPLVEVSQIHVAAYKANLIKRQLASRSIRHYLIVIHIFFVWAIANGHHPGPNPAGGIPLPRTRDLRAGIALTEGQVTDLLAAGANCRDRAILAILCAAGLRCAEVCSLQERDIHFQEGAIVVSVRSGKGGKPRSVQIEAGSPAVEHLAAYLPQRRMAGRTSWLLQPLDVRADKRRPLSRYTVYNIVRRAGIRAGVGHLSPHDLRRTYATLALDRGRPLPSIQRQMGHTMMEHTAGYYREHK